MFSKEEKEKVLRLHKTHTLYIRQQYFQMIVLLNPIGIIEIFTEEQEEKQKH